MPRGRGNPLGTTSGARCEDSRACARPLPPSRRPEEGTARPGGFLRTTGQDRGGGGGEISACPPVHAHLTGDAG